jgi:hypothetical protein
MKTQTTEKTVLFKARLAGVFYLLNIVTGASALIFVNNKIIVTLAATICYVFVTWLFYEIFKPVNMNISLIAAIFSLAGCVFGVLSVFGLKPIPFNSLAFFGVYCILIGYLILRSTFLPRILGVLMIFGGLGWLTFFYPPLAHALSPYNLAPGILGEGALTLWLLAKGVNVEQWGKRDIESA